MSSLVHSHANVLGVKISAINMRLAVDLVEHSIAIGNRGYVCVTGVHGVMEAQRDPRLRHTLNEAFINTPDGMPMSWIGHLQGFREMDRVFGPEFMTAICQLSVERNYRNFLYGGKPGVAEELRQVLLNKFPGLQIVGTYTPPFRDLAAEEENRLITQVQESRPHIIWVGLSTPKQERFMAQYIDKLQVPLLKRAGLQWLHRLMQDPGRLWRRYLHNNPAFIYSAALQLSGLRTYSVDHEHFPTK